MIFYKTIFFYYICDFCVLQNKKHKTYFQFLFIFLVWAYHPNSARAMGRQRTWMPMPDEIKWKAAVMKVPFLDSVMGSHPSCGTVTPFPELYTGRKSSGGCGTTCHVGTLLNTFTNRYSFTGISFSFISPFSIHPCTHSHRLNLVSLVSTILSLVKASLSQTCGSENFLFGKKGYALLPLLSPPHETCLRIEMHQYTLTWSTRPPLSSHSPYFSFLFFTLFSFPFHCQCELMELGDEHTP